MESSVDKMVLSGGVGAEIDARNSLQHGRGSFSPAATESGLSPDHRGDPSSMGEAANDAPSAAATSGPSPKLHSGHPPSITVPAARTVGMSPDETVDERPTAHDTTTSVTTPATSPARKRTILPGGANC
ncbi:hypothetical protein ZHAS_00002569 [Anopheles sinensis]|uniref:Uncharacterized protein n=1 Tax=Anopheles sinensis TaxID=74873 RepID=A0A084VCH5_ANOSI|nr:hypothetical protein ZHAS_00002569 [Anopheles sinensis]